MRTRFFHHRRALAALIVAASAPAGEATAWCVRAPDANAAATVGVVEICAPDRAYDQGAAVFAEPGGARVGARLLWSAPGQPATVLFDCSGKAEKYRIEPSADHGDGWQPRAGVQVECRERPDGAVNTYEQVGELWAKAAPVQGRRLVPSIYLGVNPCADVADHGFLAEFHAYFPVDKPGEYRFATLSDDASFIAIDGKLLVSYGDWHGLDEGRGGQKDGRVQLQPGIHEIEYRYAENGDNPLVEVAWQPPGAAKIEPMPPEAFAPVAAYRVERVGDGAWFDWTTVDDCAAGGEYLVALRFHARVPNGTEPHWRFDDGSDAAGAEVTHVFARANLRAVRLTAVKDGRDLALCERHALAQPRWLNPARWDDHAHGRLKDELSKRDYLKMPADDVIALVKYADFVGEHGWVAQLGAACAAKPDAWGPAGAPLLRDLGLRLQQDEVRRDAEGAACWRGFLALHGDHDAEREHVALHLAGLLVHGLDRADEARALLDGIDAGKLEGTDKRLLVLYKGDAALALGDANAARARYAEAGDAVPPADTAYAVRRRARLEAARAWCQRGDAESALRVLGEIEWETPVDRLGPETGLLKVRAWLGRKQLGFALACCKRLLVATAADDRRADVLAALAEVCLAADRRDDAAAAVATLGKEFPYSEAAARAADLMKGGGR